MTELVYISPDKLIPNNWNYNILSPEAEEKLKTSIRRFGFFRPIIARELESGELQILGGYHRVKIAIDEGISQIPVINLGKIPDKTAKEISLADNSRYGVDDVLKLNQILEDIGIKDALQFLPMSEEDLINISKSIEINLDDLEAIDETDINPELEEKLSKPKEFDILRFKIAPEEAQKIRDIIHEVIQKQQFNDKDSAVNAGYALVYLLLR